MKLAWILGLLLLGVGGLAARDVRGDDAPLVGAAPHGVSPAERTPVQLYSPQRLVEAIQSGQTAEIDAMESIQRRLGCTG